MNYCLYCGREFKPRFIDQGRPLYCGTIHKKRAQRLRKESRSIIAPCPTPHKRLFMDPHEAVDYADKIGQFVYICPCGYFHLTSRKPKKRR